MIRVFSVQMDDEAVCEFCAWEAKEKTKFCWKGKDYVMPCQGNLTSRPTDCPMTEIIL